MIPRFLAPLSELLGRQPILQLSNIFFLGTYCILIALHPLIPLIFHLFNAFPPLFKSNAVFNIACSRAQTKTQMLVFRFFAGLGGSAPLAIGGGTISDLFPPEQRGCVCGYPVSFSRRCLSIRFLLSLTSSNSMHGSLFILRPIIYLLSCYC